MKKLTKKLALASQTVRVLSSEQLDGVAGGGGVNATTTIHRLSRNAAATCYVPTTGVHTAPCRYPG